VIGLFPDFHTARGAVDALRKSGFGDGEIGVIAQERTVPGRVGHRNDLAPAAIAADAAESHAVEAAVEGAALGGLAGLALAAAAIVIPGVGPVFAAGVLGSLLASAGAGAAAGAVTGGLLGALTDMGVEDEEAEVYAEGVKRGGVLVTVHTADERVVDARRVLYDRGALNVEDHRDRWEEEGWSGYDAEAAPAEGYPKL
jgi:hypothetical protein